jgi:hypothetical protein
MIMKCDFFYNFFFYKTGGFLGVEVLPSYGVHSLGCCVRAYMAMTWEYEAYSRKDFFFSLFFLGCVDGTHLSQSENVCASISMFSWGRKYPSKKEKKREILNQQEAIYYY